jgi:hypothetical protein
MKPQIEELKPMANKMRTQTASENGSTKKYSNEFFIVDLGTAKQKVRGSYRTTGSELVFVLFRIELKCRS